MRTVIEWNHHANDTESIDNNCKCALGINHKSGRLQWCPECGYYNFAVLIPIIMIPIVVVFFLLTKLEAIHQGVNRDSDGGTNLNVLYYSDEQINDSNSDKGAIDSVISGVAAAAAAAVDTTNSRMSDDNDGSQVQTPCIIVKYGMSETTDIEERHILKDIRTSFIPPEFIIIPPKCTLQNKSNDETTNIFEVDLNDNDTDDVHDILRRSRRKSLDFQESVTWNDSNNDTNQSTSPEIDLSQVIVSGVSVINSEEEQNNELIQSNTETIPIGFHFFWKNEETSESIRAAQADIMKKYMDTSADPCVDFYQYACGNWEKLNPMPKDKAGYDTFEILRESLDIVLKDLLTLKNKRNTRESKLNNNDYENNIRMSRLRKKIIQKRSILERYKLLKHVNRKRRQLNLFRAIKRRQRQNDQSEEIDAELKAKHLYQSCMNADILEKRGIQPLLDLLELFGGWPVLNLNWNANEFDWLNVTAHLRLYNNDILIVQWVGPDIKNSDENIIQLDQTSLGLPSRDYFLQESNSKYLDAYRTFMTSIMNLLGAEADISAITAKEVVDFEVELSQITSSTEDRSNVSVLYKKMTIEDLHTQVPEIDWQRYLSIVQQRPINESETIVIYAIEYMKKLMTLISKTDRRTVSNYLLWRFVRHRINNLDDRFNESKQKFFNVLFGREESPPRWKNCVGQVNSNMGMAVGAMFVRKYFSENSKKDTLKMTHELQEAFKEILNETDWLDASTKHLAELKVASMSLKIGYPDFILNSQELNERYEGLYIEPDKYFENTLNVLRHVTQSEQSKLDEAVNKTNWQTAPAIVNAYYSRNKNQIMFPAGILQPPFYHRYFPRSLNYGGIGVVIGHELTHGFDDKGRLFDKNGNIHKWWSDYAINGFHERAKCLISQYGNYTVSEVGIAVDGESTQGENIADNGGIRQAFRAYENWLKRNDSPDIDESETLPGLNMTSKQLFFLNFAQIWCGAMRPEATRNKLKTAVHSPGKFRVIGTLSNSEDFAKEFDCSSGTPMNPSQKCSVW